MTTMETMGTDDAAEREAARLALEGTPLQRTAMALRAGLALIRDPDDTRQVFTLGLLVNRRTYPTFLARLTADDEGAAALRERPAIDSRSVDFDALRALPDGTLGREYVRFLDTHRLDPDLFQRPPRPRPMCPATSPSECGRSTTSGTCSPGTPPTCAARSRSRRSPGRRPGSRARG